ncbi:hypothetical protein JOS77_20730 [Chromobacterium haemolyticum]|nr:hypothetical protein JOS77_20730 [Chromobacterium haemolyticum]
MTGSPISLRPASVRMPANELRRAVLAGHGAEGFVIVPKEAVIGHGGNNAVKLAALSHP